MGGWPYTATADLAEVLETVMGWLKQSQLNFTKTEVLQLGRGDFGLEGQLLALDSMPLIPASTVKNLHEVLDAF